jgi:hypothetical protein
MVERSREKYGHAKQIMKQATTFALIDKRRAKLQEEKRKKEEEGEEEEHAIIPRPASAESHDSVQGNDALRVFNKEDYAVSAQYR